MKRLLAKILLFSLFFCVQGYASNDQTTQPSGNQTMAMTVAELNKIEEENFLKANKIKQGVVSLADGLHYKEIVAGDGPIPMINDTVTVNYSGTLVNGIEFDSSYKRDEPATFPVSGVISGWTEALKLMKVGSTWELYIPAKLAYGVRGVPPTIGPNQMLIFRVQLLEIKR